jgi:hypothetical protein
MTKKYFESWKQKAQRTLKIRTNNRIFDFEDHYLNNERIPSNKCLKFKFEGEYIIITCQEFVGYNHNTKHWVTENRQYKYHRVEINSVVFR